MKFYYSHETTPLNFHKAFYKVLCPIAIVFQALLLFATIVHLSRADSSYDSGTLVFNLLFYALRVTFLSLITYGFAKKKEYAWYMVYAYLGLHVLSGIISAIQSQNAPTAVGAIIGACILPTLIGIYYYKRKPIFIPSNFNKEMEINNTKVTESKATLESNVSQTITPNSSTKMQATICFCRKCGNKLISNSIFCNKCGSKIDWN